MKTVLLCGASALVLSVPSVAQSGGVGTVYEQFTSAAANDLSNTAYTFTPNATGGYDITRGGTFNTSYTNQLTFRDDQLQSGFALGFTINMPGAHAVSAIQIDSNGWAAPDGFFTSSDFTESTTEFQAQATRIAMLWDDLNPSVGGAIYFDTFPGLALVTFDQVPEFSVGGANTFQLQIRANGSFTIAYGTVANDCLVGFSIGSGLPAQAIDFTAGLPFSTTGAFAAAETFGQGCGADDPSSFYEQFDATHPFDLSGLGVTLQWTGVNYIVIPGASPIVPPTGAGQRTFGDDDTQQIALPFALPTYNGPITDIYLCSNGWLAFEATTSTSLGESLNGLLTGPAVLAFLWDDLDPRTQGTIDAEYDSASGIFHITFTGVPEYSVGGANDVQVSINPGGGIEVKYGTCSIGDCLVGLSPGNGALAATLVDLSGFAPFFLGTGRVDLALEPVERPVLGTTVSVNVDHIPASSLAGVLNYGIEVPSPISLGTIGAPGCFLNVLPSAGRGFPVASSTANVPLPLPNLPGVAGVMLSLQAVVASQSYGGIGIATTNGVRWTLQLQ
ncbi:MAG: hypothetical protein IPM29_29370 [Planctomycetes bacterium]|nr:hypothetical protein [Planctomycetota bacterium]